ncbi:olfactory receptor 1361-like [Sphaerodactylus townsendi]|uniref:olfactory receptor 1361-like n=1 Tax=Sphaerodactylus townsendi TaxID=933632 RepID=UPI0020273609|nr:olfactory receptor 1361-like [Sphaerodactylus townsendi]
MANENQTGISEFVLLGLSTQPQHQNLFFLLFLSLYLLTLLGNLLIVLLVHLDNRLLHTPMYFFLSQLSLADLGFVSSTVPKILVNLMSPNKTISFSGCLIQMYFFLTFGNTDSFLLACMAYDRYMAICHPLHYATVMSHKRCLILACGSWILSIDDELGVFHSQLIMGCAWLWHLPSALLHTLLTSRLSFCSSWEIPYFFCDVYPLLELSCSSTSLIKVLAQTEGVVDILGPFVLIMISYMHIFCAIMKVPSAAGKRKAFSTCGSHLTIVVLFYGTISCLYFQPTSAYSAQKGTITSLLYAVVIPMLNPFIYTLRNYDIKAAIVRLWDKSRSFQRT